MKQIGLFFGSFNPIHVGHLIIANSMVNQTNMDEVWFVVSPQSPFKAKKSLLADHHRLALVMEAVEDNPKLKVSNIEFELPKPSYTINTLVHLEEKFSDYNFSLIMGEDNLRSFHKWKNYIQILDRVNLAVYPRAKVSSETHEDLAKIIEKIIMDRVTIYDVPVMDISASFIRDGIKSGKDMKYLLTEPVFKYITEMNFYR